MKFLQTKSNQIAYILNDSFATKNEYLLTNVLIFFKYLFFKFWNIFIEILHSLELRKMCDIHQMMLKFNSASNGWWNIASTKSSDEVSIFLFIDLWTQVWSNPIHQSISFGFCHWSFCCCCCCCSGILGEPIEYSCWNSLNDEQENSRHKHKCVDIHFAKFNVTLVKQFSKWPLTADWEL